MVCAFLAMPVFTQTGSGLDQLKKDAVAEVDRMAEFSQQMVDQVFSYGELGFQEFETSRYLTDILKKNGFQVKEDVAGIPTAWIATWGSGKPVIALGSDIDGIPKASQKPGVAYHDPIVEGAPGHGEGHNSGVPLQITAALAVKRIMEREKIPGTLMIWPGVAEELVATKAYYIREGLFKDVDICLFAHVGSNLGVSYGPTGGSGLVSVEYVFSGESAHSAAQPWRGRSALDAVELMNVAWEFRREHLRTQQRSHYIITGGGDQPNVVPSEASVWYYFRETDYARISQMHEIGNTMAQAAAMMTGTTFKSRILGSAWPGHFNKTIAETMYKNIQAVGLPQWSDADQTLAKGIQREVGAQESGLPTRIGELRPPIREPQGGPSDDIGDISWNVPTATLGYPSNIPGLPGHHWANAVSMATPIAHKGVTAGAKVQAMTILDFLLQAEKVKEAWEYFRNVQTKGQKYIPLIGPNDKPATHLNTEILAQYRPQMRHYYFDSSRYKTYLEQLGIKYPTVKELK
ncbi:MAG: amidohydrolase [Acidobacteria bacterium]|nr:amidohydrolase [Acidobacteriota bacterium]